MGKHDMPSLQFKVEGGRLVPASPYEAEVLDTYQRGSEITVTLHQKRSLPLLRKYWAVLRDVVTNGNTPWQSADEASDALKLALGVTDISKTVKGQWFIRPGSISFTSMDEAAFRDFFEKAMAILAEVTGIDPDELSRRYSHLAEQEPSSVPSPNPADDAGSGEPSPPRSAPHNTADEADHAEQEAGDTSTPASGSADLATINLMEECRDKMLGIATDENVPDPAQRRGVLEKTKDVWKNELAGHLPFVKACFEAADRIIKGNSPADEERDYLTKLIDRVRQ